MAQGRQQNNGSRRLCPSAAAKISAEPPKAVCPAGTAEPQAGSCQCGDPPYQTRLFACERQMAALRQENAQLEAACEQARQEAECAGAHAEQLRQELAPCGSCAACAGCGTYAPQPEPSAAQSPHRSRRLNSPAAEPGPTACSAGLEAPDQIGAPLGGADELVRRYDGRMMRWLDAPLCGTGTEVKKDCCTGWGGSPFLRSSVPQAIRFKKPGQAQQRNLRPVRADSCGFSAPRWCGAPSDRWLSDQRCAA